ncbi:hypothetical protein D3C85_1688020 [compost metagenome]
MAFIGSEPVEEFDRTNRVLTRSGNRNTITVKACRLHRFVFDILGHRYREVSISILILVSSLQSILSILIVPLLIDQTKYTAAGNFGFVLIILLNKCVFV